MTIDIDELREAVQTFGSQAINEDDLNELLSRLEAAESDAIHQKALADSALRVAEGWERKCDELRALVDTLRLEISGLHTKIAQMERQVPICRAEDLKHAESLLPALGLKPENHLYALPGAQPMSSEPASLPIAVADLVAQMEIVNRVGFVDTPNDKDSCAAFCVAEGTWLELTRCVESLAAALAAAAPKPETKK